MINTTWQPPAGVQRTGARIMPIGFLSVEVMMERCLSTVHRELTTQRVAALLMLAALPVVAGACTAEGRAAAHWNGTMDTLASGQVVVRNTTQPFWPAGSEWQVVEELRIGTVDGDGPEVFGSIHTMDADPLGRIWVFDSQAQELRVFGEDGRHVRTIGRRGSGPGEFAQVTKVELAPDGNIWVMDPQNNRISVFDTAGTYIADRHAAGGFIVIPWPGRFDTAGRYYAPIPRPGPEFRMGMLRYDTDFTPLDTLEVPHDPIQRERFELRSERGSMMAGVPYQGELTWRLSPAGTIWAMISDEYRLFELTPAGDTLRTVTREYTALPVTSADMDRAREDMEWFIEQGGEVDWSKIPDTKPATETLYFDDRGNLWVMPVTETADQRRLLDVFDPEGRFLGTVRLPFPIAQSPFPVFRGSVVWAVTRDDLDIPWVVKARIVRE